MPKKKPLPVVQLTPRQREIAELLTKNPEMSRAEIARKLGITRQAVSSHLRSLLLKLKT